MEAENQGSVSQGAQMIYLPSCCAFQCCLVVISVIRMLQAQGRAPLHPQRYLMPSRCLCLLLSPSRSKPFSPNVSHGMHRLAQIPFKLSSPPLDSSMTPRESSFRVCHASILFCPVSSSRPIVCHYQQHDISHIPGIAFRPNLEVWWEAPKCLQPPRPALPRQRLLVRAW